MNQTMRYLRFAVLGKAEHPRRSPRRRAGRRGPARDSRYKAWIRTLPCAKCGSRHQVEAAHTGSDGGMRQKASDYSCVPLCYDDHQGAPDSYHRIDGGREGFERANGLSFLELVERLNAAYRGTAEYLRGQA